MNDIRTEVRTRLSGLQLSSEQREEVIEEITHHLELAVKAGEEHIDVAGQVLAEVGDWSRLKQGIERSKERGMKDRLRKIWLPALGTGFVAYAAQSIIAHLVAWPRAVRFSDHYVVYTWQWLLVLIVTGALGAYWSRMMGGSVRDRVVVALAPSEILGAFVVAILPLDLGVEWAVGRQVPYALTHPMVVVTMLTWMVVLPAVPSIIGAIPFLGKTRVSERSESEMTIA